MPKQTGREACPTSPGLAWWLPDVGLAVSILTLFYCLLVYDGSRKLFRDSDSGWHIRTGEAMLAGAGFPRTDPYSFSRAGEPWFAWEWAADAGMGMAHRMAGLGGVALLYAVAIAAALNTVTSSLERSVMPRANSEGLPMSFAAPSVMWTTVGG